MFNFLISYIKPYKWLAFLIIFFAFAVSLMEGVSAGLLIPLIGTLSKQSSFEGIPQFFLIFTEFLHDMPFKQQFLSIISAFVVVVIVRNICKAFTSFLGAHMLNHVVADIRKQGLELLLRMGMAFFDSNKAGDIAERINKQSEKVGSIIQIGVMFIVQFLTTIVLFVFMCALSWKLTLCAIVNGGLILFLMNRLLARISVASTKNARVSSEFNVQLFELLGGIKLIKSYGKETSVLHTIMKSVHAYRISSRNIAFGNSLILNLTEVLGIVSLGILSIVMLELFHVENAQSSMLPLLLTFVYIVSRIIPRIQYVNRVRGIMAGRMGHVAIMKELLDTYDKPFVASGSTLLNEAIGDIAFKNVSFAYEENKNVLHDVSLLFRKGAVTALVGSSGSGKSTLVNLVLRFYDVQKGAIEVNDQEISDYSLDSYRRRFGIVSQDTFIFNASVFENIAFGSNESVTEAEVISAAKKAHVDEFVQQLPEQYETMLGDRGVRLSGGQRQRISIARAILRDPDVLVLDEATSSLDTVTEKLIQDALDELSRGRTVIIVAHRLSTIDQADSIVVLKSGRIAECGTHDELLALHGEYEDLYKEQYRSALGDS